MIITATSVQKNPAPIIKAKFPSTCALTGRRINIGDTIFYYPQSKTVELAIKVYAGSNNQWLRTVLTGCFEQWVNAPQRSEERSYYFGSFEEMDGGSYGSYHGAVDQAIENIAEEMHEENTTWAWLNNFDLAAAFQL